MPGAPDAAARFVDGAQHERGRVDVGGRQRPRRGGVGQANDGRSADVAAPVGRHARRLVREVAEQGRATAAAVGGVPVDRREPVPPAPLDAAARDDRRGQVALREPRIGDPPGGRAGRRREELERSRALEHRQGDPRLVDPEVGLANAEHAPVVGPLGYGRVHRRQVGWGQPRPLDEVDDQALVALCIEERAACREPVPAGAARLLVVLLGRLGKRPVDDRADVGLVDAHAERGRGADDVELAAQERGQGRRPPLAVEAGVVGGGSEPTGRERLGDLLACPPPAAVDDRRERIRRVQKRAQDARLVAVARHRDDGEHQVGPVKARARGDRVLKPEGGRDVVGDARGRLSR